MKLDSEEIDALNMTENWFGGSIGPLDIFVASIRKSVMTDLVESKHLRKKWLGWEITRKGKEALDKRGITSYSDTRI